MIRYPFVFLLLSVGGVFFSFYEKKYEETLPLTIGGIIVYLFIAYILNILHIAYFILLAIIGFIYLYSAIKFFKEKDKKKIIKNIFTPGFFIFLISYIIIYFIVRGREVLLWDELRLWGAYPKILFYDGGIQLGEKAKLTFTMQSYEPGMPLFQFFFTKSTFKFIESDIFFAYAIVGVAPLIACMKKISYKNWYYLPILISSAIVLPLALANSHFDSMSYYYTLYIEPILGTYFAYTLFLSTKEFKSKIDYATFIICLGALVLFKDTGIMFALTAIISYLIINRSSLKKELFPKLIPLGLCLLLFISWKGVQKIYESKNMYSSKVKTEEIITFFTGMNKEQKQILKDFNTATQHKIFDSNFDRIEKYINFNTVFILVCIGLGYIVYIENKKEKQKYKIVSICYLVGSVVFILGTLFLYIFSLHIVVCFERYSSVVLNAGILFIILYLLEKVPKIDKQTIPLLVYSVLFITIVTPLKSPYMENILLDANNTSKTYTEIITENTTKKDSIILVFGEATLEALDGVIYHHHIYMDLIDEGYDWIPSIIMTQTKDLKSDSVLINKELTLEQIMKKYDYAYFMIVKDEDKEQFQELLNTNIEKSTLFKIKDKKSLEAIG